MEDKVKQVIVIRTDLNMRKGKMCAQASHASLGGILQLFDKTIVLGNLVMEAAFKSKEPVSHWLSNSFFKIVLGVDSEEALLDIYNQAKQEGLNVCLITDQGHTEFHGVHTNTCLSIGPDFSSRIGGITGHLKLL